MLLTVQTSLDSCMLGTVWSEKNAGGGEVMSYLLELGRTCRAGGGTTNSMGNGVVDCGWTGDVVRSKR